MCHPKHVRIAPSKAHHISCTSGVGQMQFDHFLSLTCCALHFASGDLHPSLLHSQKAMVLVFYQMQMRHLVYQAAGLACQYLYQPGVFAHPLCKIDHRSSALHQMGLPQTEDPWHRTKACASSSSVSMIRSVPGYILDRDGIPGVHKLGDDASVRMSADSGVSKGYRFALVCLSGRYRC